MRGNEHDRAQGVVGEEGNLARLRALMGLSAALASRNVDKLRRAIERARVCVSRDEVEEVILQSYLFLGYPLTLNAFGVWREVSGAAPAPSGADDWTAWQERGEEVCRTVYGDQYEGLRENIRALHPDMERWMVAEGYGKVLGRPHLALATRELCISALLAVLGTPRQLYSHLRGALNAGATPSEVEDALREAGLHLDPAGEKEAWEVWQQVRSRSDDRQTRPSRTR